MKRKKNTRFTKDINVYHSTKFKYRSKNPIKFNRQFTKRKKEKKKTAIDITKI